MLRTYLVVGTLAVATILFLGSPLHAQRADRGVITGVVTDPTGSALAGATVKIKNLGTGVETTLTTNASGAYSSPLLILGNYSVTVDQQGFKTSVSSGIVITGAETVRQDISLAVGSTTESVEVVANDALNVTTPDVSHTVDQKYYEDLPTITAADVRLAESMLQIQPGYLPMKPNGDPMFRGSQFNSRINGGQTMATENFFDGAAFGYASGHQQSQESAPPEDSIQEMKVITTTYSAQYGHTSGGFIEYNSRSGTSSLHGSAYEYFANSALNARGFFDADCDANGNCTARKRSPVKNNAFGFTLGGPVVIPKVYNGRNKTFFFTNIDLTRVREGVLPGFGNSTPIPAFRNGDFSSLLTGAQATMLDCAGVNTVPAVDALGRPIMVGAIYNPATTTTVASPCGGTVPVRDPYPGNIIPAGDPLLSVVTSRITPLMASPDRAGIFNNVAGNPAGDQTWVLNARNIEFRVDHDITQNFRISETFYWNNRPSIRNCGEVGGCNTQFSGVTEPQKNTNYYGNGFYQRVVTHHAHTQFEWIIRNNMSNHTTIAWDRWFMGGNPLSAGAAWPQRLWQGTPGQDEAIPYLSTTRNGGLMSQDSGPPLIDFSGDYHPEYNSLGEYGWGKFGFETNNRWQFADDLTWVKSKHTVKVGFEYRWHQFNHSGWATGNQGGEFRFDRTSTAAYNNTGNFDPSTGEAFASMLLGQVYSSTQTLPFHPQFYEGYFSPWINDEFKATNRLTLTFGLRFDYQRARTESQNRYSTFDPNTPNPGAGGIPGAIIFAGHCPGCSGRDTFEDPNHNAWGPRFGFAYRVNDKTAVRGGYGMYYSGISFAQFQGDPTVGYNSNPTVPNISNGFSPAFSFDQGFPATSAACPGGLASSPCILQPPFIDPTIANGTSPLAVAKNGLTLPRYQNWSLTFERELVKNMRLDVSYIANRGTRLTAPWQAMGIYGNMNDPSVLSLGTTVLNSPCNSGVLTPGGTCAGGVALPYSTFNGNVAQALRLYPQYQNIIWRDVPLGSSMYNALELVLEQRVTRGLQFRVAYTYSKLYNDGSETGQSGDGRNVRIQNPACPHKCEWGLSDDDTPHVFIVAYTWELPGAKKWHGAAGALLGGWNFGGVLRYESGRPLNITMDNGTYGGILFNPQRRPDRVKGTSAYAKQVGSFYNPLAQNYFNTAGWSNPGANPFGTAPRADGTARGFPTYNEDMSLFKIFNLTEQVKMRFESQFGNIFNRTDFCNPSTFWDGSSATFGSIGTQCNYPRSIQFALKFSF